MADVKIKRALIAVYDKSGIVDFARALVEEFGVEIISTGGTARHLKEAGVLVTMVEEITGFPEMLDGRVKTLHPKIHAAILADRDNPSHMRQLAEQGIEPIDMVVVNLYPFEDTIAQPGCTFEDAIEMIDIGGPCLLRAAAKNHKHVLPISLANDYEWVLGVLRGKADETEKESRRALAVKVFGCTVSYDHRIRDYLVRQGLNVSAEEHTRLAPTLLQVLEKRAPTRYGENPHQHGAYYRLESGRDEAFHLAGEQGKKVSSFNNFLDANAALELCAELTRANEPRIEVRGSSGSGMQASTCVFIKHTNACGVGVADSPIEAYRRAYLGDPNAAMGGILACNFPVTADFATTVMETYDRWGRDSGAGGFFVEVWIAPTFDDDAREIIRTKKKWGQRVRVLRGSDMRIAPDPEELDQRGIAGGVLLQTRDLVGLNEDQWEVVTERKPTEREMADLRLAWLTCKHTKSNAITIFGNGMLIGNGAGQMSRVMSCRIAVWLARENGHLGPSRDRKGAVTRKEAVSEVRASGTGPVAASDAFFPFRDGPDLLLDAGATAIIQPSGSKRDADTIAACNERGAAMVFTHTRHFKH